ncbi:MAG: hypothetical protein LBT89_03025 [Planctomycetaceae bacterium]|jgi:hypothetical protein|nr:hypothetical protein [Planctomycetaceae bacterium]
MTAAGWIMMCCVVGSFTGLLCWCVWKVVTAPAPPETFAHIELDTPDMQLKE